MKYTSFILPLLLLGLPILAFAQGATTTTTGFVPLTNIPQLTDFGNSFALDNFLNQLYRISIGIAGVVAVLQIMRAGIMYMGGDSVTKKSEAKQLIGLAIGGLVLVLSPVIVFSLVNPKILTLKIDTSKLGTEIERAEVECVPACGAGKVCNKKEGMCYDSPIGESLQCLNYLEKRSLPPTQGTSCSATLGVDWEQVTNSCCTAFTPGGVCCGRKASEAPPAPESGFSYQVAVRETRIGVDAALNGQYCIRYEPVTPFTGAQAFNECAASAIGRNTALSLGNNPYVFVRECSGKTNELSFELKDLPTCAP